MYMSYVYACSVAAMQCHLDKDTEMGPKTLMSDGFSLSNTMDLCVITLFTVLCSLCVQCTVVVNLRYRYIQ